MFGMVQTCNLITASTAVNSKKIKEITVSPFTIEGLRLQSLLAMVFKTPLVAPTFDKGLSFRTYMKAENDSRSDYSSSTPKQARINDCKQ